MNTLTHEQDAHLPGWAYRLLALVAAVIGLACSAITARFFVIGLERTESDSLAREALIAAGVLMIVVELAAFGLAALLPRQTLRALRLRLVLTGLLLVGFECVTIYSTQYLLVRGADAHSKAEADKIASKKGQLATKREEAASIRNKAEREDSSSYPYIREKAKATRAEAEAKDREINALDTEISVLEEAHVPTMTDALGQSGVLAYNAARALLISIMGLVMMGASGALLRAGRAVTPIAVHETPAEPPETVKPPRPGYAHGIQAAPAGLPAALPSTSATRRWLAAGVPLAAVPTAFAAPTVTVSAPVTTATAVTTPETVTPPTVTDQAVMLATVTVSAVTHEDTVMMPTVTPQDTVTESATTVPATAMLWTVTEPAAAVKAPVKAATVTASTATTRVRYERIRAGIEAGTIKPSVRAVQAAEGGGTAEVRACLQDLARDGILVRAGQGWALRISDPNQIALAI